MRTILILLVLAMPVMADESDSSLQTWTWDVSIIADTCKLYQVQPIKYEVVKEIYTKPEPDSIIVKMDYATWKKFLEWAKSQQTVTIWDGARVVIDTIAVDTLKNWEW